MILNVFFISALAALPMLVGVRHRSEGVSRLIVGCVTVRALLAVLGLGINPNAVSKIVGKFINYDSFCDNLGLSLSISEILSTVRALPVFNITGSLAGSILLRGALKSVLNGNSLALSCAANTSICQAALGIAGGLKAYYAFVPFMLCNLGALIADALDIKANASVPMLRFIIRKLLSIGVEVISILKYLGSFFSAFARIEICSLIVAISGSIQISLSCNLLIKLVR
jgi:hypothetical protein